MSTHASPTKREAASWKGQLLSKKQCTIPVAKANPQHRRAERLHYRV